MSFSCIVARDFNGKVFHRRLFAAGWIPDLNVLSEPRGMIFCSGVSFNIPGSGSRDALSADIKSFLESTLNPAAPDVTRLMSSIPLTSFDLRVMLGLSMASTSNALIRKIFGLSSEV